MNITKELAEIKREERALNEKLVKLMIEKLVEIGAVGAVDGKGFLINSTRRSSDKKLPVAVWVERGCILKANYTWTNEHERLINVCCIMDVHNFGQNKKIFAQLGRKKPKFVSLRTLNCPI